MVFEPKQYVPDRAALHSLKPTDHPTAHLGADAIQLTDGTTAPQGNRTVKETHGGSGHFDARLIHQPRDKKINVGSCTKGEQYAE